VPTEAGLLADARAARVYLESRDDVDGSRIVYFGESLGSAVAMLLAAELPPAALILRSPFPSLVSVGRVHYPFLPVGQLLRDRFASIDVMDKIACPALVIAGDRDGIIPFEQSRQLFEALQSPKTFLTIQGADHNDYELLAGEEMLTAMAEFLGAL
jgi:fermentation-respiration switch protein FrsA (DUF1100 family)